MYKEEDVALLMQTVLHPPVSEEAGAHLLHTKDVVQTDEGLVFNPYNPVNVLITLQDVQTLLVRYGLPPEVHRLELYRRAFVHRSYTRRGDGPAGAKVRTAPCPPHGVPLGSKSNERLEFLGDGVLELVAKYLLYRRFPHGDEGFMTLKKIAMVKNEAIGKVALDMGLHKWLLLSRNSEDKKTRTNLKKLGCVFEAFVGAVFLDGNHHVVADEDRWFESMFVTGPGFQLAQRWVEAVFEAHVNWVALVHDDDNYKNLLQVKLQREFKVTPHYVQSGYDGHRGYCMGVYLCMGQPIHSVTLSSALPIHQFGTLEAVHRYLHDHQGRIFLCLGAGTHRIKRKAEQLACEEALRVLDASARPRGSPQVRHGSPQVRHGSPQVRHSNPLNPRMEPETRSGPLIPRIPPVPVRVLRIPSLSVPVPPFVSVSESESVPVSESESVPVSEPLPKPTLKRKRPPLVF
jgi:dsRNA-specific ribonuclease